MSTNKKFAKTCKKCSSPVLSVYPNTDHTQECNINNILNTIKKEELKLINLNDDIADILKTNHGLPFYEFKISIDNFCCITSLYAPEWLKEGISLYYNSQFGGISLIDFLTGIAH